jgi:hypothetical protein
MSFSRAEPNASHAVTSHNLSKSLNLPQPYDELVPTDAGLVRRISPGKRRSAYEHRGLHGRDTFRGTLAWHPL